jgi:hypothetical protein
MEAVFMANEVEASCQYAGLLSDLVVHNHGTILIVEPETEVGAAWLEDNIQSDARRWGNGIVVEPRYIRPIIEGAQGDGLVVRS